MFVKIILLGVAFAVVTAQHRHHHHHGQGHAHSSQSITIHHDPKQTPSHHKELHREHHAHKKHHHEHKEHHYGHHEHHAHKEHHVHKEHQGHHTHYAPATSSQSIHQHHDGHLTKHVEYYGHPKYEFSYEVKDPRTHDIKHQHEHRDGDVVKGEYGLHQPDGTVRIVKYHADKKSGFNAEVKYEGHAKHIVPEHHHHHH